MLQKSAPQIPRQILALVFRVDCIFTKKTAPIYGVEISNGRWLRRSSFHLFAIITQFNTKWNSILGRKNY